MDVNVAVSERELQALKDLAVINTLLANKLAATKNERATLKQASLTHTLLDVVERADAAMTKAKEAVQ